MFLKSSVISGLLILCLALVNGNYYNGRYRNGTSGCVVPNSVVNVTLEQVYRYGGGFVKSVVNFPPDQDTHRKCITVYIPKLEGDVLHVTYTSETIARSELAEESYLAKQVRPGVFEARPATNDSTVVVLKYVLAQHPDWTVCTGCLYVDGKFVSQSSSLLSKTRVLNPLEQLRIYRKFANINVYRSMEVGQFYCHYNKDFQEPKRGGRY